MNRRQVLTTTLAGIATAANMRFSGAQAEILPAQSREWQLAGTYFEACSCEVMCPCIFQSAPSHGDCAVLYAAAGGFPAALAGFFERFVGVKTAPIRYDLDGKKRAVEIPGVLRASIHAITGQEGGDAVITGHPLGLAPGNPLIVAQSDEVTLTDYEWNWKFSGRSGGYSPFKYQSA
jgi:hypothetical protein